MMTKTEWDLCPREGQKVAALSHLSMMKYTISSSKAFLLNNKPWYCEEVPLNQNISYNKNSPSKAYIRQTQKNCFRKVNLGFELTDSLDFVERCGSERMVIILKDTV